MAETCAVDGCDRPRRTRGWCMAHYNQWLTTGENPVWPFTDEGRFQKYVDRRAPDECWPWLGTLANTGYGKFRLKGRHLGAHRVSYQIANGDIPEGLVVRHACDNRGCVNPNHLLVGTARDNVHDAIDRNRFPRGETQGRAKLTLRQVVAIRELWRAGGSSQRSIANQFGVSKPTVNHIVRGYTWAGLGENA